MVVVLLLLFGDGCNCCGDGGGVDHLFRDLLDDLDGFLHGDLALHHGGGGGTPLCDPVKKFDALWITFKAGLPAFRRV